MGTTKDTPIETTPYLLDLPQMETRHKVEQVKAYLNAMQDPKNPLHEAVKEEKGVGDGGGGGGGGGVACWQEASHGCVKQNSLLVCVPS